VDCVHGAGDRSGEVQGGPVSWVIVGAIELAYWNVGSVHRRDCSGETGPVAGRGLYLMASHTVTVRL